MKAYNLTHGVKRRTLLKIVATIILFLIIGGVVVVRQTYYQNLKPVSTSQRNILVTIPLGAGANQIGAELQKQQVIKAAWAFEWYVRNSDKRDQLKAGTYYLQPNLTVSQIVDILTQGKEASDLVTILPGKRLDQIKSALVNKAGFSPEEVNQALDSTQYKDEPALADLPAGASLEGYLYPDSFQKTANTKVSFIIRESIQQMNKYLTPGTRDAFVKQGLTVHQAVTLASIVQQEAGKPADMATVAQVFLLRLKLGKPLESDVTNIYGAINDEQAPSVTYESAYNTFTHTGLPPGPISNVTKEALNAVAHPSDTDYLFFVAGDDGIVYFSHTLEEHQQLVKEHCKKLCSQ